MTTPGCVFWKSWFAFSVRSARSLAPHQNMRSCTSACATAADAPNAARPTIAPAEFSSERRVSVGFIMGVLLDPLLLCGYSGDVRCDILQQISHRLGPGESACQEWPRPLRPPR